MSHATVDRARSCCVRHGVGKIAGQLVLATDDNSLKVSKS